MQKHGGDFFPALWNKVLTGLKGFGGSWVLFDFFPPLCINCKFMFNLQARNEQKTQAHFQQL